MLVMKLSGIFFALVLGTSLMAQNPDFKMDFKLRFENQKIYCDVIPKDDYEVLGLQFGILHNSYHVVFDTLTSNFLLNINRKIYNEICPRNVRIFWTARDSKNQLLKKGIPFLTLEYHEMVPGDHYICLMPSQSPSCSTMIREVLFEQGNNLKNYNIPDVCVEYKIKDGTLILDSKEFNSGQDVELIYHAASKTLEIKGVKVYSDPVNLQLFDIFGRPACERFLWKTGNQFKQVHLLPGIYAYVLTSNSKVLKSGKLLI